MLRVKDYLLRTSGVKGVTFSLHKFFTDNVDTRYNSADSVPTSNLVCITEVAIRTTLCIAGII